MITEFVRFTMTIGLRVSEEISREALLRLLLLEQRNVDPHMKIGWPLLSGEDKGLVAAVVGDPVETVG